MAARPWAPGAPPVSCAHCGAGFAAVDQCIAHFQDEHARAAPDNEMQAFRCGHCAESFGTPAECTDHMVDVHSPEFEAANAASACCERCGMLFATSQAAQANTASAHTAGRNGGNGTASAAQAAVPSGARITCGHCGRGFTDSNDFTSHICE